MSVQKVATAITSIKPSVKTGRNGLTHVAKPIKPSTKQNPMVRIIYLRTPCQALISEYVEDYPRY